MCKYTPFFCDILRNLEQIERAIALSYPIARLFLIILLLGNRCNVHQSNS